MPIWGFIFILAALVVFVIAAWISRSLVAAGLALLSLALMLTYCTAGNPVHF